MKEWIRKIAIETAKMNAVPLFGNAPSFEWDAFASALESRFSLPKLNIVPTKQEWKEPDHWEEGLGEEIQMLSFSCAPIGEVFFLISKEDKHQMSSLMMRPSHKTSLPLSHLFQEAFLRFALLESLDSLKEMPPFQELSFQICEKKKPYEQAFGIDLKVSIEEKVFWSRLLFPSNFQSKWIQHFSSYPSPSPSLKVAETIFLPLSLKICSIYFTKEEWEKLKPGDFIPLELEGYSKETQEKSATLSLSSIPLFFVKLGKETFQIKDYADYHEDKMNEKEPESQEESTVSIKDAPLEISVELSKLKMSLGKLLSLSPGNTLELPASSQQMVFLTLGGRTIAKAELVYLGDKLGLQIIEI